MVWRNILAISFFIFAGCDTDFPKNYYVSEAWDSHLCRGEFEAVHDAAEEWNKATCLPLFRYQGRSADKHFNFDDLQDGKLVVYPVWDAENSDVNTIAGLAGDFSGYSIADIIIKRAGARGLADYYFYRVGNHASTESVPDDFYLMVLRSVVTHEFGHRLGLGHNENDEGLSVMSKHNDDSNASFVPTLLDVEQLRSLGYPCPKECPTRPAF